jgi:hypothetical protein
VVGVSYVKEIWLFEGVVGRKKIAGSVEFENGVLWRCGVTVKDYSNEFQRHDIDCSGVAFDSENDVFNLCFELVLSFLASVLKDAEDVEVRVGKKEVYVSRTLTTLPKSNENDNNNDMIDLMISY